MFNEILKEAIMRKSWFKLVLVLVIVGAFFIIESGLAQLTTPRVSPYTSITQRIGLTDILYIDLFNIRI